jgi:hypothetical protein
LQEGGNRMLADVNGDSGIDISDPIHILLYLFKDGPQPVLGTRCTRLPGCPETCFR